MNKHNSKTEKNTAPDWLKFVQPILGALTLIGAAIGGTLHFLLEGRGYPEFQLFVLALVGLFIFVVAFFAALMFSAFVAAWTGKTQREETAAWKKWVRISGGGLVAIYFFTYAMVILLLIDRFVGEGPISLIESIRADLSHQERNTSTGEVVYDAGYENSQSTAENP